jgi:hypothetical protein
MERMVFHRKRFARGIELWPQGAEMRGWVRRKGVWRESMSDENDPGKFGCWI